MEKTIEAYERRRARRRFFVQASAAAERAGLAPHEAQSFGRPGSASRARRVTPMKDRR